MNYFRKIKTDFKQFGLKGFIKRIIKKILRCLGISYESYYYMVNNINYDFQKNEWNKHPIENVSQLSLQDFNDGDPETFNEKKMSLLRKRFDEGGYLAYGIKENNHLLYSCMLSLRKRRSSNKCIEGDLKDDEAIMIDAYCSPLARGRGFHGRMNNYRLMKCVEHGKSKCIAIVLKENIPALKSQLKVGYKILFSYYVLKVNGKEYTNFHKKLSLI